MQLNLNAEKEQWTEEWVFTLFLSFQTHDS